MGLFRTKITPEDLGAKVVGACLVAFRASRDPDSPTYLLQSADWSGEIDWREIFAGLNTIAGIAVRATFQVDSPTISDRIVLGADWAMQTEQRRAVLPAALDPFAEMADSDVDMFLAERLTEYMGLLTDTIPVPGKLTAGDSVRVMSMNRALKFRSPRPATRRAFEENIGGLYQGVLDAIIELRSKHKIAG